MKKIIFAALMALIAAATQAKDDQPDIRVARVGGSSGPVALIKQTEQREGSAFTVVGKSTLDFSHRLAVQYRYVAGAYALHLGQSDVALTYTDYFADAGTSHNESKLIATPGLYDGDSLYVRVVVAALDSSVVLDTLERGYLIDHDIVTLAMGNRSGGTLFNPSGLIPSQTVTVTAANFKSATTLGGSQADSLNSWAELPSVTFMRTSPLFNPTVGGPAVARTLMWFDFSGIPDNVTIVEAYLCIDMKYANNVAIDAAEGLYAVLDTLSADGAWLLANTRSTSPFYQNTSHNEPRRGLVSAWSPLLNDRTAAWHYGISSPLAHDITGDAAVLATGDDVLIDVKEMLQYWVDFHDVRGIVNSGFMLSGLKAAGGTYQVSLGGTEADKNHNPTLIVRYQNKPYSGYDWGDYPFAFAFTTDDQHADNYNYYKPLFDARGIRFTLFTIGETEGIANRMTNAQLLEMYNDGYEIASHGWYHRTASTIPTDSIGYFLNRGPLATILGLSGADTMNIGTYAYAYGDTADIDAGASTFIDKLEDYGYRAARLAWNVTGVLWPTPTAPDAASEIYKVGNWKWDAFADVNDTYPDSIRAKLRKVYGYSAHLGGVDGGLPLTVLSHGTVAGSSYDEMDPIPLGLLLDEIQRRGDTWICTFDQMMSLYRSTHEAAGAGGKVWVP